MTDFSNFLETTIRDWLSQNSTMPTPPTNLYAALHNGTPGDAGANNEIAGNNYARVALNTTSEWDTPATNLAENAVEIAFPEAHGSWGTLSHVSIWNESTAGTCLMVGDLDSTETIAANDTYKFAAGNLDLSIN